MDRYTRTAPKYLAALLLPVALFAQVTLVEHVIDNDAHGAASVYACDVDGDGDKDLLAAMYEEDRILWWRNDGGNPITWTRFVIGDSFLQAGSVYAADIDSDSLTDVLGVARVGDEIAWWRNNGGDPLTWTKQTIGKSFGAACVAQGIDLDGDGDMDVVGTAQSGNQVAWWRNDNEGGEPFTWTKFVVDSLARAWPIYACDLDGDQDNDIVAASGWAGTNEVKWWENRGSGRGCYSLARRDASAPNHRQEAAGVHGRQLQPRVRRVRPSSLWSSDAGRRLFRARREHRRSDAGRARAVTRLRIAPDVRDPAVRVAA
jgi:hypothetical protein